MGIVAPLVVRQEATHLLLEVYPKEIRQIEGFFIDTSPDFSAEQLAFMTKELAKKIAFEDGLIKFAQERRIKKEQQKLNSD